MEVDELLGRPVVYRPVLTQLVGGVKASLMLSQAMYWQQKVSLKRPIGCPGSGWWYHTMGDWFNETALTKNEQLSARKLLRGMAFWNERRAGIPARMWFFVDLEVLKKELTEHLLAEVHEISRQQGGQQGGVSKENLLAVEQQSLHTEITTEINPTNEVMGGNISIDNASNPVSETLVDIRKREYLRLACIYSDIRSPAGFSVSKRRQWAASGALPSEDLEQLSEWAGKERRDIQIKKNRQMQDQAQERKDKEEESVAIQCESRNMERASLEVMRSIEFMKSKAKELTDVA